MPQQPFQVHVLGTLAAVMLASCNRTINTLPPTVTPTDPVQQYALRIPDSREIKAGDFDAALYPHVRGAGSLGGDTRPGGRASWNVSGVDVTTPGDAVDVLVALNPAALKVDLKDLRLGGTIVVDTGAFTERNLTKAGFPANPIEDGSLAPYQVLTIDITRLTAEAVKALGLSTREAHRCRNMWALGLMLWMYGRDRQVTTDWLRRKFADRPELAQANVAALNAGHAFGETAEMSEHLVGYTVPRAPVEPGRYRAVR